MPFLNIDEGLGLSIDIMHNYIYLVRKKTLENLKHWLEPLLFNVTLRWIEGGASI